MFGHTPADQGEPDVDALLGSMRPELREGGSGPGTVMPDRTRQAMPSGEDGWVYTPDQATAETLENTSHLVLPAPPLPGCKQDPIPEKPTPAQHRNTHQNSPCDPHSNPLPAIYHPYTALSMTSRSARSSARPTRLSHSPPLPPAYLATRTKGGAILPAARLGQQRIGGGGATDASPPGAAPPPGPAAVFLPRTPAPGTSRRPLEPGAAVAHRSSCRPTHQCQPLRAQHSKPTRTYATDSNRAPRFRTCVILIG
jgi:hypothetical protein